MDRKGAALAIRGVGRGLVQGLAVVNGNATGRQIDDDWLGITDLITRIQQCIGRLRTIMLDGLEVGAGDELHGAVVQRHIIQRKPATDQVGWGTAPVGIVLVPIDGAAMTGRLVERLVMK